MPSTATRVLDGLSTSVAVKAPCRVAAIANITLAGLQTVNGVAVVENDRVLVTAQNIPANNGIYMASTGQWQRSLDADGNRDLVSGTLVMIQTGTDGIGYELTSPDPILIGTTALTFVRRDVDSALRTELVDGLTAGKGSALLAIQRRDWEVNQGVTIADYSKGVVEVDVQRYGILPNNIALATTNTARLRALVSPLIAIGFQGKLIFPPVIGGDTYHFNNYIEVRDNTHFDLQACRLLWTKAAAASDQFMGLLTMKTGVRFENGTIEANITGTVGNAACALVRIGSRSGYKFGAYPAGIFDKTDLADLGLAPQGDCTFHGVKFKSNNPYANCASMVFAIGGHRDVLLERCLFEGSGAGGPGTGFYSEMGDADNGGDATHVAKWHTSHAINLQLRQIRGKNLNTVGVASDDAVVAIVGANDFVVDGVYGESCNAVVTTRHGESHYKNAWTPDQTAGPRSFRIHGVKCGNTVTGGAIIVSGSGAASGQFSDANCIAAGVAVMTLQEKLDLIRCEISGFDIRANAATGTGIVANCPVHIHDGVIRGGAGIQLLADCSSFLIESTWVLDAVSPGIRADTDSTLLPGRKKRGIIRDCKIAGSIASVGVSLDYCDGVLVENNQIGYILAKGDAADEATQTTGVSVASNGFNVLCCNNNVKTSGGANAYAMASIGGADESGGNAIVNPIGTTTYAGKWRGVVQTTNLTITAAVPGNLAVTYSNQQMGYIREAIGNRVDYAFNIQTSAFTYTTATGQFLINGLPYTVSSAAYARNPAALSFSGLTKAGFTQFTIEPSQGANQFIGVACGTGVAGAALNITDFPTGGSVALRAAGHYFV